jgi:hypothetical protein
MAEKKSGYGVGAFAHEVHAQQKYIVFDLDNADYDVKYKVKGAERFLPHTASHELLHTLGFDHPRTVASDGETPDTRSWEKIRQDIASRISAHTALGTLDPKTGKRRITYSFAADTKQVPHGNPEMQKRYQADPNGIVVENFTNLGENPDPDRNATHGRIRDAMREAFAMHEGLFNVTFEEARKPNEANILIYAANIPLRPQLSFESARGRNNAYTHDVTILSYNQAEPGLWASAGVGEVYVAQTVYGLPPEDPKRHIITAERLAAHSGVMWDHKPLAIRLTESPMLGALTIDMGAHPFQPAITGVLKNDKEEKRKVRQHIGALASMREVDATGSGITLDVTGTDAAVIKVGKGSAVKLNGNNNTVVLGPGTDAVTHAKGYGHVITGLSEEDSLSAREAGKVRLQHWDVAGYEKGTLVTFMKDTGPKGSVFVRDATPEKVIGRLKDMVVMEPETPQKPLVLNALDKDKEMTAAPPMAIFREQQDIVVTASQASGHSVSNLGPGNVVVKMSRPQYDSRTIVLEGGKHYALRFRNGDGTGVINLPLNAKIAVFGPDGGIEKVISLADSLKEAQLALALKKGVGEQTATEAVALTSLPFLVAAARERT